MCALTAACSSEGGESAAEGGSAAQTSAAAKTDSQAVVLYPELLEGVLPRGINMPPDVSQERTVKAWDMSDPSICQSEEWRDDMCAKAVAVGSGGYTDLDSQEVVVRLISFDDPTTADAMFEGEGTVGEVGQNPPGDEIDGYEAMSPADGWGGRGFNVRQGAVIAKVEYGWAEDSEVSDRLMDITKMVVERIRQAQSGDNPTASLR
ncbi:hypothetical protein GCM10010340_49770 [Streptomyces griseoloalbus]|nr:hypothetical protein GCM10010340_49770 [Streptomyces albaduncus]